MAERKKDDMATPKPPRPGAEVGFGFFLPFTTPYEDVYELLKVDDVSVKQLVAMRKTDGQARALYRLLTLPLRKALQTATFVPEKGVEGGDEEAKFIEQVLTLPRTAGGMKTSFESVIASMLLGTFDGFSPFEMVYQVPESGPLKGKWTIKQIKYLPAETIRFLIDERGSFQGFRQYTHGVNGEVIDVKIPKERAVYYAANEEERKFYGVSYFQAAFYHYDRKMKLYYLMQLAAQRNAVGTRVGKLPLDPEPGEKRAFQESLSSLGVAQWMTMPNDYEVESLKESTNFDFLQYLNHHNSQMSKSILAPFFDDNQGSGGDANLVSFDKQSDSLFVLMLQTIMNEIATVINHYIIPRFIDWNFSSKKYPQFRWGAFTDDQVEAIKEIFMTLAPLQTTQATPEFVREMEKKLSDQLGLPIDYEEVEEKEKAEKELLVSQGLAGPDGQPLPPQLLQARQNDPTAPNPGMPGPTPPEEEGENIPPELLPEGFALTHPDSDVVELVRGKAQTGIKRVATKEGELRYGVPIGTPITDNMMKGKEGDVHAGKAGSARAEQERPRRVIDPYSQPGSGIDKSHDRPFDPEDPKTEVGNDAIIRVMVHPKLSNIKLLVYADGSVQLQYPSGLKSRRVVFSDKKFLTKGWTVTEDRQKEEQESDGDGSKPENEGKKNTEKVKAVQKKASSAPKDKK